MFSVRRKKRRTKGEGGGGGGWNCRKAEKVGEVEVEK
jgi:hypothetical protein